MGAWRKALVSGRSRLSDKGGRGGSQKNFFGPLGLSLVAKLVDTQDPCAPPLDLPLLVILGLISLVAFISVTL